MEAQALHFFQWFWDQFGLWNTLWPIVKPVWPLIWTLVKIIVIVAPLMIGVAYLTYAERKILAYMQVRVGPNRVGYYGLLQPIADGIKLLFKELIIPMQANKFLFAIAPALVLGPALAAWAVVPFSDGMVLANVNAGLLFILSMTSIGVYGVIIAGWASNSKYAFLGAMRSAAQMVSYELPMGFALVCVLMAAQSMNLTDIVLGQQSKAGLLGWYFVPLFPMCIICPVPGDLRLVLVTHRQQHFLGVIQVAAFFAVIFQNARFDNGIYRAGFFAETAEYAFHHIDVVLRGTTCTVATFFGFNLDCQRRTHRFTQLATDAALFTIGISALRMQAAESESLRGFFFGEMHCDTARKHIAPG